MRLTLKPIARRILGFVGRMLSWFSFQHNESGLFFFFRTADMGGAERVHAQIVRCFAHERPWVYFTEAGAGNRFLTEYSAAGRIAQVAWLAQNRVLTYIHAGFLAGLISRHPNAVVFGSEFGLLYRVIAFLPRTVRCIDLRHSLDPFPEEYTTRFADRLESRVVISERHARLRRQIYQTHGCTSEAAKRIVVIENGVPHGRTDCRDWDSPILHTLYVGRGSPEKRVHLVGRIASECQRRGLPIRVTIVGPDANWVDAADRPFVELTGVIVEPARVRKLYEDSHLLLLTSSSEGMPLAVQEAMACGCVVVCTDCGALAEHIDASRGVVVKNRDDGEVVADILASLEALSQDRARLREMSGKAFEYAVTRFAAPQFCQQYRDLLRPSPSRNGSALQ